MLKLRAVVTKPSEEAFVIEEVDSSSENSSPVRKPTSILADNERQRGITNFNSPRNTAIIPKNTRSPVTFFQKGDFIKKWLLTTDNTSNSSLSSVVENGIVGGSNVDISMDSNKRSPRSPLTELNRIKRPRLNINHDYIYVNKILDEESVSLFQTETTVNQKNPLKSDNSIKIHDFVLENHQTNEKTDIPGVTIGDDEFGGETSEIQRKNDEFAEKTPENVETPRKPSEIDIFPSIQTIQQSNSEEFINERVLPGNFSPLQGNDDENDNSEKISIISSPKSSIQVISTILTPKSRLEVCRAAAFGSGGKLRKKKKQLLFTRRLADLCDRSEQHCCADNTRLSSFCNLAISQGESIAPVNMEIESYSSSISSGSPCKIDIASIESIQEKSDGIENDRENLRIESDEDGDKTIIEDENCDETITEINAVVIIEEDNIEDERDFLNTKNLKNNITKNVDKNIIENENIEKKENFMELKKERKNLISYFHEDGYGNFSENFYNNVRKHLDDLNNLIENPVETQHTIRENLRIEEINEEAEEEEDVKVCAAESQDSDETYFSEGLPVDQTTIEEPCSQEISEPTISNPSLKSRLNLSISDRSDSIASPVCRRNEAEIYPVVSHKIVKKKKKAKKGSMLEKYQMLMSGRISSLRLWRHQMVQDRSKGNCNQFLVLKITEYSVSYGRPYFRGKILNDHQNLLKKSLKKLSNDSASSNSTNLLNTAITVLTIPEVVGQFNVKEKSALRLYPPWEVIDADKLILSVLYFNLISDDSENLQEESRINNVLIREFNCPCLSAGRLVNSCTEKFEKIKPNAMDYFFQ